MALVLRKALKPRPAPMFKETKALQRESNAGKSRKVITGRRQRPHSMQVHWYALSKPQGLGRAFLIYKTFISTSAALQDTLERAMNACGGVSVIRFNKSNGITSGTRFYDVWGIGR